MAETIPITSLLVRAREGDEPSRAQLANWIEAKVRHELSRGGTTAFTADLQATDVVSEVFVKLLKGGTLNTAPNRRYLAVATAQTTRNVLVDAFRRRERQKRGAGRKRVPLDSVLDQLVANGIDLLALHEALSLLSTRRPRQSEVVELRFFGGHSNPEIAELLGVSVSTIEADWHAAKASLYRSLRPHSV